MAVKDKPAPAADEVAEVVPVAEPVTDETNTSPKEKEAAGDAGSFCVYLGPNIRGVIQSGTVYSGTKEKALASLSTAVEKYPLIAKLIVTRETLAEDRVKVKQAGNLLNVNYNKLATSLKSK
jgi:hypothetical protein